MPTECLFFFGALPSAMLRRATALGVLVALLGGETAALDNGLGRTPAMGYNTWNDLRCIGINATNIQQAADTFVSNGLAAAGYRYIVVDDCWANKRDNFTKRLTPDPAMFPEGIEGVARHIHGLGLKLGIYTDRGTLTCTGRPGSSGHEELDAQTFADWGVDYLKEDSCFAPTDPSEALAQYARMRDALRKAGRPIYFSLCGWEAWYAPPGYSLGNSWRIAPDVNNLMDVYRAAMVMTTVAQFSRPGGWNDPDMLLGSGFGAAASLLPHQSRMQFSLWAVLAAPLLIGASAASLTPHDLETYSNLEAIAVNQDPVGRPPAILLNTCPNVTDGSLPACQQIWTRRLFDGSVAMALVNFAPHNATLTCKPHCLRSLGFPDGHAHVRDLWAHENLGLYTAVSVTVQGNGGGALLRLWS